MLLIRSSSASTSINSCTSGFAESGIRFDGIRAMESLKSNSRLLSGRKSREVSPYFDGDTHSNPSSVFATAWPRQSSSTLSQTEMSHPKTMLPGCSVRYPRTFKVHLLTCAPDAGRRSTNTGVASATRMVQPSIISRVSLSGVFVGLSFTDNEIRIGKGVRTDC